jgi:peptidyl-Asp metalloendopeptidase
MRENFILGAILSAFTTLSLTNAGFAQSNEFVEPAEFARSLDKGDMRPQQSEALSSLNRLPTTESVQVVRLNPAALTADAPVSMSFKTIPQFTVKNAAKTFEGDKLVTWSGAAGDARPGTTTLAVNNENVVGSVQTPEGPYRIWPIGGGFSAVVKVDVAKMPPEHPPNFNEKMNNRGDARPAAAPHCPPAVATPTNISVLVAYTPAALREVPLGLTGLTGLVNSSIAETNQSYQNSGINISLVAAPATPVAVDYTEAGDLERDVVAFSTMPDVAKVRAANHSNVAVLLMGGAASEWCGWSREVMATEKTAFSVVYWDCAMGPQYSFGHEIGHLQGARHNPEEDPSTSPFPYGHGFLDVAAGRRTMMAYDCKPHCVDRQPEWARPKLWGNPTVSNDARVLNETATCVAKF